MDARDRSLRKNDIQDNRIGIDLYQADNTLIKENVLHRNVEANLRGDDCRNTRARGSVGTAGGYL